MRTIILDTETYRIRAGMAAPRLVCMAWTDRIPDQYRGLGEGGDSEEILLRDDAIKKFRRWLHDPDVVLVGQSIVYDLGVFCAEDFSLVPMVCAAIEAGRVRCTKLREKIIAIAKGELKYVWDEELEQWKKSSFDLNRLLYRRTGEFHKKKDNPWQLRFDELDDIPVAWWPKGDDEHEGPAEYVLGDIRKTAVIYWSQEEEVQPEGIPGELLEIQADFALNMLRIWGVRTDPEAVAKFETEIKALLDKHTAVALKEGLMRMTRKGPSKFMKAIRKRIEEHYTLHGMAIAYTAGRKNKKTGVRTPEIATDREQLTNLRNRDVPQDKGLAAVAEVGRYQKLLTTYCRILHRGTKKPITPSWNTPLDTYRTSCSDPNLQNGPRASAFRPCFVARPGWVFVFCDYDTIEMRTLAQTCLDFGFDSALAVALKEGKDVHVDLAAEMLGISYEDAYRLYKAKDPLLFGPQSSRQYSKIGNYGLGGGMGAPAFRDYARGYDIDLSIEQSEDVHRGFRRKWYEMPQYFAHCSMLAEADGGEAEFIVFPRSGRVRGKVRYTAICNGFFQELAAFGAKKALWRVVKESIAVPSSPLYGARAWLFNHDEIGLEVPLYWWGIEKSHGAARHLETAMVEEMQACVPDIPIGASATMSRRWFKGADPVFLNGMLVPGKPEKYMVDDKEKIRWVIDLEGLVSERAAA